MRLTLDTNFLISANLWDYSVSHKLLMRLIRNNIELFTTKEILTEFSEVLSRDFKYGNEEIEKEINHLISFIKIIEPISKVNVVKDDIDDNKIIDCAIDSLSDYIITYDGHLLNLKSYENIKILTPEEMNTLLD